MAFEYVPKHFLLIAAFLIAAGGPQAASAQSKTGHFNVKIKVQPHCSVGLGMSDIDFGAKLQTDTNLEANNIITVNCAKGTLYAIGLIPDSDPAMGKGQMVAGKPENFDVVNYQLRSTPGGGPEWGNTENVNRVTGEGEGIDQTFNIYATVEEPSLNVAPDDYAEKVTVAVYY